MRFCDLYVLRHVCHHIQKRANQETDLNIRFLMTISPKSLQSPDFITLLCTTLHEFHVSPFMIRFLFNEEDVLNEEGQIKEEIQTLIHLGFTIWLKTVTLRGLKAKLLEQDGICGVILDRDLLDLSVKSILIEAQSRIQINHEASCQTFALGIDTKEQYDYFKAAGVERMAGSYFMDPKSYEICINDLERKGFLLEDIRHTQYFNEA